MIEKDVNKRFTIEQVIYHPWFKYCEEKLKNERLINKNSQKDNYVNNNIKVTKIIRNPNNNSQNYSKDLHTIIKPIIYNIDNNSDNDSSTPKKNMPIKYNASKSSLKIKPNKIFYYTTTSNKKITNHNYLKSGNFTPCNNFCSYNMNLFPMDSKPKENINSSANYNYNYKINPIYQGNLNHSNYLGGKYYYTNNIYDNQIFI